MILLSNLPLDTLLWWLALELASLPLLELGWSFAWCGRTTGDTGGWFDLWFGWLKIHGFLSPLVVFLCIRYPWCSADVNASERLEWVYSSHPMKNSFFFLASFWKENVGLCDTYKHIKTHRFLNYTLGQEDYNNCKVKLTPNEYLW